MSTSIYRLHRVAVEQLNCSVFDVVADEVVTDIDISRALLGHEVTCDRDARLIVFEYWDWKFNLYVHRR